MLQQDLAAHEDQDDAAGELRPGLILQAEDVADLQSGGGEDKGGAADEADGGHDVDPRQQGEGDAHGQGVDAGGDGQEQHGLEGEGAVVRPGLLVIGQGLLHHAAADEAEQDEGHPVVDGGDVALEGGAQEVTEARHQGLEAAEPGADDEVMPTSELAGGETLADGDGEGVHGEAHGDEKEFQNAHIKYPPGKYTRRVPGADIEKETQGMAKPTLSLAVSDKPGGLAASMLTCRAEGATYSLKVF